jgi:hypothetical protein
MNENTTVCANSHFFVPRLSLFPSQRQMRASSAEDQLALIATKLAETEKKCDRQKQLIFELEAAVSSLRKQLVSRHLPTEAALSRVHFPVSPSSSIANRPADLSPWEDDSVSSSLSSVVIDTSNNSTEQSVVSVGASVAGFDILVGISIFVRCTCVVAVDLMVSAVLDCFFFSFFFLSRCNNETNCATCCSVQSKRS